MQVGIISFVEPIAVESGFGLACGDGFIHAVRSTARLRGKMRFFGRNTTILAICRS